jgi:hypothetical protein
MKIWLNENKIFFETATATLLSFMAIMVSVSQCSISKQQIILSETPIVLIEPAEIIKGTVGEFKISLINHGLADLTDIKIYEDYYVSLTPMNGPITLYRFGPFSTQPNTTVLQLKSYGKSNFAIYFTAIKHDNKVKNNNDNQFQPPSLSYPRS